MSDIDELPAKRTEAVIHVKLTESTWMHGPLKVVLTLATNADEPRVKVIDTRPTKGRGQPYQWEGTVQEFKDYYTSLRILSFIVGDTVEKAKVGG